MKTECSYKMPKSILWILFTIVQVNTYIPIRPRSRIVHIDNGGRWGVPRTHLILLSLLVSALAVVSYPGNDDPFVDVALPTSFEATFCLYSKSVLLDRCLGQYHGENLPVFAPKD